MSLTEPVSDQYSSVYEHPPRFPQPSHRNTRKSPAHPQADRPVAEAVDGVVRRASSCHRRVAARHTRTEGQAQDVRRNSCSDRSSTTSEMGQSQEQSRPIDGGSDARESIDHCQARPPEEAQDFGCTPSKIEGVRKSSLGESEEGDVIKTTPIGVVNRVALFLRHRRR
jgi:hypothetical protein